MSMYLEILEGSKLAGTFAISSENEVYGELTINGPKTSLYLQDKEFFHTLDIPDQFVTGVLHDLTKVSLIQCIPLQGFGSASRGKEGYHFARLFPHYVVYGDRHIGPAERIISEVHFVMDDASTLFYDFDAFGSLVDARPFIEQIAHANDHIHGRAITTGPNPQILYFTGKHEIFSADTILGKISASHNPRHTLGGPGGVKLENTIFVSISFEEPCIFEDAISHISTLLRYLEVLVGRPQNLLKLDLRIRSDHERPVILQVYWSMPPKRESSHEDRMPHPSDVLLDPIRAPKAFCQVLRNWLDRKPAWHDARGRFFDSFAKQQHYSIDRLIASVNMFDILPSSAVPPDVQLSEELKSAREDCQSIFERLPQSPERDSVLGALGRVGKSNLKHKIHHRAQLLINQLSERFPELVMVTDEAVNCRNHYVHGSAPRYNYSNNFHTVMFFTNTLEFIFAASDLIEAGWDVKSWSAHGTTMSHPFGRYRINYQENLKELKTLLP